MSDKILRVSDEKSDAPPYNVVASETVALELPSQSWKSAHLLRLNSCILCLVLFGTAPFVCLTP